MKSESEVAQSCPTLSDPMDCSLPGSSVHGVFQATVLERGAIATALPKTQDTGVTTVATLEIRKMKLKRPHNVLKVIQLNSDSNPHLLGC